MKQSDEETKFRYLEDLFQAALDKSQILNSNYKLGLYIIHKYDIAVRTSNAVKNNPKSKDQYYTRFLNMLSEFEEKNNNVCFIIY